MSETLKDHVRRYWEAEPCGTSTVAAEPGTSDFFAQVEQERYRLEPFIPGFAQFARWEGKRVLEIGIGLGTDFMGFVRAGADAVGIDLTEAAVESVRARLADEGLEAELHVADAESLPFPGESFDLVYSWGVLHHTPDTEQALREVRRVLRAGGEARVMLYSRRSWVALGVWLRYGLGKAKPFRSLRGLIADHMESPGTKAYTQAELDQLFSGFDQVTFRHFRTPYDRRVGRLLVNLLPERLGWFVGIVARR
jgi:ubiquinone/menaquinone biosynthesis C-methylase UbiE